MSIEIIYLTGFRFDFEAAEPEFYFIMPAKQPQDYFPLVTKDARLVLIDDDPESMWAALTANGLHVRRDVPIERLNMDFALCLDLIRNARYDELATILNVLNIFDDILPTLNIKVPEEYRSALILLADHVTLERSFGEFFDKDDWTRSDVIDGIRWCVGAIFTNARFVR